VETTLGLDDYPPAPDIDPPACLRTPHLPTPWTWTPTIPVDHGLVKIVHFPYPFPHSTLSKVKFEPHFFVVDIEILMRSQVTTQFHRSLSHMVENAGITRTVIENNTH